MPCSHTGIMRIEHIKQRHLSPVYIVHLVMQALGTWKLAMILGQNLGLFFEGILLETVISLGAGKGLELARLLQ